MSLIKKTTCSVLLLGLVFSNIFISSATTQQLEVLIDAGSGNYLTYINGKGYSQYSYLNKSGNYAFTPSSWMKAAGLDVSMPSASNGYTMRITNKYIKIYNEVVKEINNYITE